MIIIKNAAGGKLPQKGIQRLRIFHPQPNGLIHNVRMFFNKTRCSHQRQIRPIDLFGRFTGYGCGYFIPEGFTQFQQIVHRPYRSQPESGD